MASYLFRNSPVPTSEKKFTFSTWFKICKENTDRGIVEWYKSSTERHHIFLDDSGVLRCYSMEGGVVKINIITNALFRDLSAWYHIVVQSDNTLASSSDRFKLWVNGVAQTFSSYSWTFAQNVNINVFDGSGTRLNLGTVGEAYATWLNGYLADTYYIDGSIIAHTEFGETDATTGIWKPKSDPTIASFGNAGVHLKYENSGNIGLDSSGNGNNFSTSGTITQTVDTPSNVFCTGNPLNLDGTGVTTLINGNLTHTNNVASTGTLAISKGKWYFEIKRQDNGGTITNWQYVGFRPIDRATGTARIYRSSNGDYYNGSAYVSYGASWGDGDIIGVALDYDNDTIEFYKNGVSQGLQTSTGLCNGDFVTPIWQCSQSSGSPYLHANFGNGYFGTTPVASAGSNGNGAIFEFDCPTNYYALNTKNINTYG